MPAPPNIPNNPATSFEPAFWPRVRLWLRHCPTPAEHLRRRQESWPPRYDPRNTRVAELRRRLPPELDRLIKAGRVSLGEVGEPFPGARAVPLASWGYAIEFTSGLMRLIYSVARALGACNRVWFPPPRPPVEPMMTMDQFAQAIAQMIFRLRDARRVEPPIHPIDPEQRGIAETYANAAEYFLMMHELAHVWIAVASLPAAQTLLRNAGISPVEEFAADHLALFWCLRSAWVTPADGGPRPDPRMTYAGVELALRIYAFMEHIGIKFEASHPGAGLRLAVLRISAGKIAAGAQTSFDSLRTIALANDEFLEAAERLILRQDSAPPLTREQLRIKLLALFEAAAKSMAAPDFALRELGSLRRDSSAADFSAAMADTREHFRTANPRAAQLLEETAAKLPPPAPPT